VAHGAVVKGLITLKGMDTMGLTVDYEKALQGGLWALSVLGTWFMTRRQNTAKTNAEIASANASASVSDAEGSLYQRLREELDALRNDINRLRSDLDIERRHSRRLELHVWKLERLMRAGGLEPPPFVDEDEVPHAPITSGS
jgi:hypothetical protein